MMWQLNDDLLKIVLLLIFLIGINTGLLIVNVISMSWPAVVMNILAILVLMLPVVKIIFGD